MHLVLVHRTRGAFVLLALALALAPGSGRAADGTVKRLTTTGGPSERSTPAVGAIGHDIYLFGGVRDDFRTGIDVFYNDLYRFNAPSKTWTQLSPTGIAPVPRAFAAGVGDASNRKFYVFGGATYQANFVGFVAHSDLWEYDAVMNEWTRLGPLTGGPGGRSRPNMWLVGDKLYVFGGVNSLFQTFNDLWSFDLGTNTWMEVLANDPDPENTVQPRTRHEGQSGQYPLNGKLVVYGGEHINFLTGDFFTLLDDTWSYDLASGAWDDVTPSNRKPQPPRNYGATAIIGNVLYLQGGDIPGGSQGCGAPFPQNPSDDLWRFAPGNESWTELSPVGDPLPRLKRSVAAVVNGKMYIFAGYDFDCAELTSPGQVWNHDVYVFNPTG